MKLDKGVVDRRVQLLRDEGVTFVTCTHIGREEDFARGHMTQIMQERGCEVKFIEPQKLIDDFDAVLFCTGATRPFDPTAKAPGRDLKGIYNAMDFLTRNTKSLLDSEFTDEAFTPGSRQARDRHRRRRHRRRLHRHQPPPRRREHRQLRTAGPEPRRAGPEQPLARMAAHLSASTTRTPK